ncbi:MAG: thioredoxin family protein [Lentisphaeria bacterium]|nr:thioredoxin family protein [Lentisphaeria bacterium]
MKKLLACLLTVFTVGLFAQGLHWNHDFSKALDISRKTGKPVFAFFTGSDWCGWCMKLDREILSKRDMVRYLNDNFVLFKADFPRKNQPPKHIMAANSKLQLKYGVRGYPTIIITDGKGTAIGRTGYMKGGPAAMKAVLNKYIRKAPAPKKPVPPPRKAAPPKKAHR